LTQGKAVRWRSLTRDCRRSHVVVDPRHAEKLHAREPGDLIAGCTKTEQSGRRRRFVKKQQMGWTLRGAHLLLQTRTKVLNDELVDVFRRWYPQFRKKAA